MKIIKNKFIAISTLLAATSLACCTSFAGTTNDSKQLNEIINALSSQEYTNIKLKFQNDPLLHKELLNQSIAACSGNGSNNGTFIKSNEATLRTKLQNMMQ